VRYFTGRCGRRHGQDNQEAQETARRPEYRFRIRASEVTMARRSMAERLAQLDAQRKNLQARMGKQERAKDTRRKILLGAFVLHRLEKPDHSEFSKNLRDWLGKELPEFLSRDDDLALFDDLIDQAKTKISKKTNGGETRQQPS
jgi:hypothetical protein